MKNVLWVGDACVASGFARATHYTLETLRKTCNVSVLGLNYKGDPHPYGYNIYPAWIYGEPFGTNRIAEVARKEKADLIVIQNDPWNFPQYLEALKDAKLDIPVVGIVAVDGKNCNGKALNGLTAAIFWTNFGRDEAIRGGYTGPHAVVPLGIDLKIYQQMNRPLIRKSLARTEGRENPITETSFVVGNVNRNQARKRLDLTVQYFCEWVSEYRIDDAYLMLHACPTGEEDYDLESLMRYYGLHKRLVLITPDIGDGVDERFLAATYNIFDVQLTTSMAEGFGLTVFEGMACGVPQIVPAHSALEELCGDAAIQVPCSSWVANRKGINTIVGVMDREESIKALQLVYSEKGVREELILRGRRLVNEPRFRWGKIGTEVEGVLAQVMTGSETPLEEVV